MLTNYGDEFEWIGEFVYMQTLIKMYSKIVFELFNVYHYIWDFVTPGLSVETLEVTYTPNIMVVIKYVILLVVYGLNR